MFVVSFVAAHKAMKRIDAKKEREKKEQYLETAPKSDEKWTSLEGQLKASKHILDTYTHSTISPQQLIPKQVIKQAKGIIFITVYKAGLLMGYNIGSGAMIIRRPSNNKWCPPISVRILGLTHGMLSGGSFHKKEYIFAINTDKVINHLVADNQLKIGDRNKACCGPLGRDQDISIYPKKEIYCYPDTKLKGITITVQSSANETFYDSKGIQMKHILAKGFKMRQDDYYQQILDILHNYVAAKTDNDIIKNEVINYVEEVADDRTVALLHSKYNDIDKEVIEVILKKQCCGIVKDAVNILDAMTQKQMVNDIDLYK